jgi:hypothetical protein
MSLVSEKQEKTIKTYLGLGRHCPLDPHPSLPTLWALFPLSSPFRCHRLLSHRLRVIVSPSGGAGFWCWRCHKSYLLLWSPLAQAVPYGSLVLQEKQN